MSPDSDDQELTDEIKREDGLERYWLFYNGEWVETILGLGSAIGAILWCFLYVLGYSQIVLGYVLVGLAIFGFVGWYFVFKGMQAREASGWKRERKESRTADRRKMMLAAGLWIFIVLSFGAAILMQRR
jgi:hypothetical protein